MDEESESGSDSGTPFILSRAQWLPSGSVDSDQDSDFELDSSADAVFITSDFETEYESSEDDSGFFTPPNSPIIDNALPQLTDDEESDDKSEDEEEAEPDTDWGAYKKLSHSEGLAELPLLLLDSEDEEEDPGPITGPGNIELNSVFTRLTLVDEGLAPPAFPGAWVGYSDYVSE